MHKGSDPASQLLPAGEGASLGIDAQDLYLGFRDAVGDCEGGFADRKFQRLRNQVGWMTYAWRFTQDVTQHLKLLDRFGSTFRKRAAVIAVEPPQIARR